MPALQSTRQASQAPWFDSEPAVALRVLERQLLLPQLSVLPTQPWLWIAPSAAWLEDAQLGGRGLRLFRQGQGYAGDTRCALPLPLASESVNAVVLQHVTAGDAERLLDECERVLMPGGHLWLSSLNPFSPYRTHWRQQGSPAGDLRAWQRGGREIIITTRQQTDPVTITGSHLQVEILPSDTVALYITTMRDERHRLLLSYLRAYPLR